MSREGEKREKVHSILPQAECHLSWEDVYHSFDVFTCVKKVCVLLVYLLKCKKKNSTLAVYDFT